MYRVKLTRITCVRTTVTICTSWHQDSGRSTCRRRWPTSWPGLPVACWGCPSTLQQTFLTLSSPVRRLESARECCTHSAHLYNNKNIWWMARQKIFNLTFSVRHAVKKAPGGLGSVPTSDKWNIVRSLNTDNCYQLHVNSMKNMQFCNNLCTIIIS